MEVFVKAYLSRRLLAVILTAFLLTLGVLPAHAGEVNKGAIVLLVAKDAQGKTLGTGTGFIVKPDGVLITNYHVLVDADTMDAVFEDGTRVGVLGVKKVDRLKDFAVLKLEGDLYSTLPLGDSDRLKEYDYASALGFPTKDVERRNGETRGRLLQTFGFVLGIHPQAHPDFSYIYSTTPLGPGFSGGPLVDQKGRATGLATVEGKSINLSLPINFVKPFLEEKSVLSFKQLQAEDRNSKEAFYYKANFALYGLGDADKAQDYLQKSLALDPGFALAHYDLAAVYRDQGQLEKAIEEYKKALELSPNFPEALSNLGGYEFRRGRLAEATEYFKRAIRAYPNFIQALSNLGATLIKTNKAREAVPYLQKAVNLDPGFGMPYFNLGNAYYATGEFKQAKSAYHEAMEYGVDFLSLHWKLYEIYNKESDSSSARQELELILKIDPLNSEAQQKLDALPKGSLRQ